MNKQCEMIVGFLTPHRCPHVGMTTCAKCGRLFCDEHVGLTPGGLICLACQRGLAQPVAVPEVARTFDASDMVYFSSVGSFDDEDDAFADLS